jgi:hypothetical protein
MGAVSRPLTEILHIVVWPVTVLVAVAFLARYFRTEWRSLIGRLSSMKLGSFSAEAQELAQAQKSPDLPGALPQAMPGPDKIAPRTFHPPFPETVLSPRRDVVRASIEGMSDLQAIAQLLDVSATLACIQHYESTFAFIFGSQLRALEALNSAGVVGLSEEEIRNAFLPPKLEFGHWFDYLLRRGLAQLGPDGRLQVTSDGRAFLTWCVMQGYSSSSRLL